MLGHLNSHDKLIKTIIIDGSIEEESKEELIEEKLNVVT